MKLLNDDLKKHVHVAYLLTKITIHISFWRTYKYCILFYNHILIIISEFSQTKILKFKLDPKRATLLIIDH